jgi:hypothetical protein
MSFDLDRASALTGRISLRVPISGRPTERFPSFLRYCRRIASRGRGSPQIPFFEQHKLSRSDAI